MRTDSTSICAESSIITVRISHYDAGRLHCNSAVEGAATSQVLPTTGTGWTWYPIITLDLVPLTLRDHHNISVVRATILRTGGSWGRGTIGGRRRFCWCESVGVIPLFLRATHQQTRGHPNIQHNTPPF